MRDQGLQTSWRLVNLKEFVEVSLGWLVCLLVLLYIENWHKTVLEEKF